MIERACWNCENCHDVMDSIDNESLVCDYSGMEINQNGFCEHWKELRPHCLICRNIEFEHDESYNPCMVCGLTGKSIDDIQSKCDKYLWIGFDGDDSL